MTTRLPHAASSLNETAQQTIIGLLARLVSVDTQNPPKTARGTQTTFDLIQEQLVDFDFLELSAENNSRCLLATRGHTDLLFNVHMDTVPVADGWQSDPFTLRVENDKAYGLGACDIKGAAAALIWAAKQSKAPMAILFSNDEEHGRSEAIHHFLKHNNDYKNVLVAEPTDAKAVLAHRGINSGRVVFTGKSGHASNQQLLKYSAIHLAVRWCEKVLSHIETETANFLTLNGIPFNIGAINGGIKANMIADHCEINIGCRPLPGFDVYSTLQQITAEHFDLEQQQNINIEPGFYGPSLPAVSEALEKALDSTRQLAESLFLPVGDAVNFWTEASLFSEAGLTSLVYGPGDIAQAHTANEWVELSQLFQVAATYLNIINHYN